ncbi:hypothetical protein FFF34_007175 [Inquilinus sp. KBS0705]|nr:hypothetical protein FFF34_007175 [Inquilinus sp. KBS0705]
MKNLFKTLIIGAAITVSFAACSGHGSNAAPDSAKDESATPNSSKLDTTAGVAGANGSAMPADSGPDHSGSGGTASTKRPPR